MSDTTTIEIREDQRDALRDLKKFDRETYKEVLDRLLNGENTPADNINMDFSDINTDKLPLDVPNDLQERLDRIESGVKEATNAAQSADRKLEDLGR